MLTAKPLATICYNTPPFLANKLDTMVKARIIERYTYIIHDRDTNPDTDELKKTHIHLWLKPGKRLDTLALRDEFDEVDPTNDKPLRCLNFKPSDESHWLRYVLHDPTYLELKGLGDEDGRTEYRITDLVTNEPEELEAAYVKSAEVMNLSSERQFFILMDYITTSKEYVTYAEVLEFAKANGCVKSCLSMHQQVRALISEKNYEMQKRDAEYIDSLHSTISTSNELHRKQLFTANKKLEATREELNTTKIDLEAAGARYGEIIDDMTVKHEQRLNAVKIDYNEKLDRMTKAMKDRIKKERSKK